MGLQGDMQSRYEGEIQNLLQQLQSLQASESSDLQSEPERRERGIRERVGQLKQRAEAERNQQKELLEVLRKEHEDQLAEWARKIEEQQGTNVITDVFHGDQEG